MTERKITITAEAICFEGFELPTDVPDLDVDAVRGIRALTWALERIIDATSKLEQARAQRNELAAQQLQARLRLRSGLH